MQNEEVDIEVPAEFLENWQEVADLLTEIVAIPAALIMRFVDPYIEVFIASSSEGNPYHAGDREMVFDSGLYCETVMKTREQLLVPDALSDPKWENNPDVRLGMISYLGFPILMPDRKPFGTICILDNKPNAYSGTAIKLITKFRSLIESHLGILYMNRVLGDENRRLTDYIRELKILRGLVPICSSCKRIRDNQGDWQPVELYLNRFPEAELSHGICPDCVKKLYPEL